MSVANASPIGRGEYSISPVTSTLTRRIRSAHGADLSQGERCSEKDDQADSDYDQNPADQHHDPNGFFCDFGQSKED